MRLIDTDKLELDADYDDGEFWAYSKRQIDDAPTVKPETGHWIDTDTKWNAVSESATVQLPSKKCSKCGKLVAIIMWRNFCPACGTKMEVENED